MRADYDVVIIGGGPAGSVFAKELAIDRPELKILLVDGQGEKQSKVCGGLLAPDAQKVLARLNLTLPKNILADPQIFSVETIDLAPRRVRHYQRHYLNMDRYAFDRWLLSLIPECVDIANGRCISVVKDGNGNGYRIRLCSADGDVELSAPCIVGADGGGSIVRRCLLKKPLTQYAAIQQWFSSGSEKQPPYSCIFDSKTSDSCSWTIRKDGYTIFGGAFKMQGCRKAFEAQKARLEDFIGQEFGEPIKTEACLLSSPRKFSDFLPGEGRVYLVGEAAGFISASSFEGISGAILSGKLLAEAFNKGKEHNQILRQYRQKTLKLRIKLWLKTKKRWVLCSPLLRQIIMKSGIQSIRKY